MKNVACPDGKEWSVSIKSGCMLPSAKNGRGWAMIILITKATHQAKIPVQKTSATSFTFLTSDFKGSGETKTSW